MSLQQDPRSNQSHTMMLQTYTPQEIVPLSVNFLHLRASEIYPRQDFKVQDHFSRVKDHIRVSLSQHTLRSPTNVPTNYQIPIHMVSVV